MRTKAKNSPAGACTYVLIVRAKVSRPSHEMASSTRLELVDLKTQILLVYNLVEHDMRQTWSDVLVACARNAKFATVNVVDRYELNVLLSEDPSNLARK